MKQNSNKKDPLTPRLCIKEGSDCFFRPRTLRIFDTVGTGVLFHNGGRSTGSFVECAAKSRAGADKRVPRVAPYIKVASCATNAERPLKVALMRVRL